jgi:hypothetical protein
MLRLRHPRGATFASQYDARKEVAELGDPAEPNQPEPPLAGAEGLDAFRACRGAAGADLTETDVSDALFASAHDGLDDPAAIESLPLDELALSLTATG